MIYIYRQVMNGEAQTGFVANTSIDDYVNNVIKKHELTLLSKEQDRINHFDACDANTSPIFMAYRSNEKLAKILEETTKVEPKINIKTEDGVLHIVWP